jgi:hypothetical protein
VAVDRRHQLDNLHRSIMMLTPGVPALSREEALTLLEELNRLQARLDSLLAGLRELLEEANGDERRDSRGRGP